MIVDRDVLVEGVGFGQGIGLEKGDGIGDGDGRGGLWVKWVWGGRYVEGRIWVWEEMVWRRDGLGS